VGGDDAGTALPPLHRAWGVLCLALLTALVGVRWLTYVGWIDGSPVGGGLRALMVLDVQTFVWPWVYTTLKLRIVVAAAVVLVLGLHRRLPAHLFARVDGRWRLRPPAVSVLLGAMLWLHYLFDLNVTIAKVCATSLAFALLTESPRVAASLPRGAVAIGWGLLFAGWLVAAMDPADRLTIVAWGMLLAVVHRWVAPVVGPRERTLVRVAAVIPMNLLPAVLPLVVPLHDGARIGDGLGYAFCEVPNRGTVFTTIPVCASVEAGYDDCRDGRVVEYDRRSLREVAARKYFSPAFHGRLELVECLDDEVQVAVQAAVIHGRAIVQSALAFPTSDPDVFNPAVAGEGIGIAIAYDRARDAVFYSGEFTHRVVRLDRRTQRLEEVGGAALERRWHQPITLQAHTGSASLFTHAIDPARDRLWLVEWMQGRRVHAIDLDTRRVVEHYDVGGGGGLGVMVDVERDRLWVSSMWGIDVFDLATGARVHRQRIGTGNRSAVLDAPRRRVYVPSTVEGKIRIFDRDSFAVVGAIPVGIGTRSPYLAADGKHLFGSSVGAHYAWDADALSPPAR
jgi:hypothetical protein